MHRKKYNAPTINAIQIHLDGDVVAASQAYITVDPATSPTVEDWTEDSSISNKGSFDL